MCQLQDHCKYFTLYYCVQKRGNQSPLSKYRGLGVYSMNRTQGRRKVFITKVNAASRLSYCSVPFKPLSSPFFGLKMLYDFGFWKNPQTRIKCLALDILHIVCASYLKGQQREMVFWLNPSHKVQTERIQKILKFVLLLTNIYTLLCLLAYQENTPIASLRHLHVRINPFRVFSEYV